MPRKYTQKDTDRFWSKVEVTDDCWYWTGATDQNGYGSLGIQGRIVRAHRVAYELACGEIPDGLVVCHACDTPPCVRPDHLFLGTKADNAADRDAKGRRRGVGDALRSLLEQIRRPPQTFADRFWAKVEKTDTCWLWVGYRNAKGYGQITTGGRRGVLIMAHRASYEMHIGPVPPGYDVCHACDTPSCIRPDHLFLGTRAENMQDAKRKGRTTKGYSFPHESTRGESHYDARLTDDDVREIRRRYATEKITQQQLADEYGVSNGLISYIVQRKRRGHVSD